MIPTLENLAWRLATIHERMIHLQTELARLEQEKNALVSTIIATHGSNHPREQLIELRNNGITVTIKQQEQKVLEPETQRMLNLITKDAIDSGRYTKSFSYTILVTRESNPKAQMPEQAFPSRSGFPQQNKPGSYKKEPGKKEPILSASEELIFRSLRAWRLMKARSMGMPPYIIFHDVVLKRIVASKATSFEKLRAVKGIGITKATRYGHEILEIMRRYRHDGVWNPLGPSKPLDVTMKEVLGDRYSFERITIDHSSDKTITCVKDEEMEQRALQRRREALETARDR